MKQSIHGIRRAYPYELAHKVYYVPETNELCLIEIYIGGPILNWTIEYEKSVGYPSNKEPFEALKEWGYEYIGEFDD